MANRIPYFFYAPSWDFPPAGPIKLGNVLASPTTPERPLYTAPQPAEHEIFSTEKRQVEFSLEKLREGKFSIVTRFLSVLGLGVDVGVDVGRRNEETMSFDRLETAQFVPREEYLQRCVEGAGVRRFLEKSRYRKPVYIITGLKTVHGAKAKSLRASSRGASLGVEVDGTIWTAGAVPVGGGPELSALTSRKQGTSWEESSDFVLAYRLWKVKVSKQGAVSGESYTAGAMLGRDGIRETPKAPKLDVTVEDLNVNSDCDGFAVEEILDGEEIIACAIPIIKNAEQ